MDNLIANDPEVNARKVLFGTMIFYTPFVLLPVPTQINTGKTGDISCVCLFIFHLKSYY